MNSKRGDIVLSIATSSATLEEALSVHTKTLNDLAKNHYRPAGCPTVVRTELQWTLITTVVDDRLENFVH